MKVTIEDYNALNDIEPSQVIPYLQANGWHKSQQIGDKAMVWVKETKSGKKSQLLLPLHRKFDDFPLRMRKVLQTLEAVEQRSQLEILQDFKKMSLDVPKAGGGDLVHTIEKAVISGIPGIGGTLSELFAGVVSPPLEKRLHKWRESIVDELQQLEMKIDNFSIESLSKNEEFITTVTYATRIAICNHRKEKIEALKNICLNSATYSIDNDLQSMFLQFIDSFTVSHLIMLYFLDDPLSWIQKKGISMEAVLYQYKAGRSAFAWEEMSDLAQAFLEKIFLGIENKIDFYNQVLQDLMDKGLITGGIGANISLIDLHGTVFSTTSMGKLFKKSTLVPPLK